jgi:multidrug efflux system outer membrane protein
LGDSTVFLRSVKLKSCAVKKLFSLTALITALLLLATSCTLYRPRKTVDPAVPVPEQFSAAETESIMPDLWWQTFENEELNSLIERGLAGNLDLKRAWTRLDEAWAAAKIQGANLWPQLNLDAGASRSRSAVSGISRSSGGTVVHSNTFLVNLAASYEVDLWGRLRSLKTAAALDVEATREDLEAAAMTLTAQVAETYFSIIEKQAQQKLIQEQIEANKTYLKLTELRFIQGLASALDVYQQRQQLASTRAQLPLINSILDTQKHQLSLLLGEPPLAFSVCGHYKLPDLPDIPGTGLPADLLKRRPDVKAAELRVAIADHNVAAAVANRLPTLSLSAGMPFQSNEAEKVFDNWVWNIAANLAGPIFDAGRRKAEVERNKAILDELLYEYSNVILEAFREVEDALAQEKHQRIYLDEIENQVRLGKRTLDEARARYVNGLSDFLPVLNALQELQRLERARIDEYRKLISFRISLYRALGGAWTSDLKHPAKNTSQKQDKGEDK